jgi:hypothetical protein
MLSGRSGEIFGKKDRQGGQKLLILIIDLSIDVGGVDKSCCTTG